MLFWQLVHIAYPCGITDCEVGRSDLPRATIDIECCVFLGVGGENMATMTYHLWKEHIRTGD